MRTNLLEFLFGENAVQTTSSTLGEEVVRLFEAAEQAEQTQVVANKKPLAAALKDIGITAEITASPQWAEIHCGDEENYRHCRKLLTDPDNLHRLAELGWVPTACGDQAMSGEPADFKLGFIELDMLDMPGNTHKTDDLEDVLKTAQKFAATALDRDDDKLNPVETDDKGSSDNQKGVGKAANGAAPEGRPKGSTKEALHRRSTPLSASKLTEQLLAGSSLDEATTCAAIPTLEKPMKLPVQRSGIDWNARLKRMQTRRAPVKNEPRPKHR